MTSIARLVAFCRRRWKNNSTAVWFYCKTFSYRIKWLARNWPDFVARRYHNNVSTLRFHWAKLHFRYSKGSNRGGDFWGAILIAILDTFFRKDWDQLLRFDHYTPRPLKVKRPPVGRRAAAPWPTIGMVTPSFNHRRFLEQTMNSVLSQEFPRLQYAVIDGGSTDGSREIIEHYRDRLIYSVSEPDQGQSDALVKGFAKIDADILGYLNSDDLLTPGSLAFVADYFARNPDVDVIYSHRIIVDENGFEIGRWILPPHHEYSLRRIDYIPQETMFWRRQVFEKAGGIDNRLQFAMDWDLILKFMDMGANFRRVPCFLGCFRSHPAQKTARWKEVGDHEVTELRRRQGIDDSEIHLAGFHYRRTAAFYSIAHRFGLPAN